MSFRTLNCSNAAIRNHVALRRNAVELVPTGLRNRIFDSERISYRHHRCRCFNNGSAEKKHEASISPTHISALLDTLFRDGAERGAQLQVAMSEYLSSLRVRTAMKLTTSLQSEERETLLDLVGAIDKDRAREVTSLSIGEAVAKARLEETEKNKREIDEKTREIVIKAEEAATARFQNELLVQKKRLEAEMEHLANEMKQGRAELNFAPKEEAFRETAEGNEHPVLGRPVLDLGYKRLHVVSSATLATIPVWEKQRTYRHDRARMMAKDKMKSLQTGLPGIISIFEGNDGRLAILDGQHRVGMLALLQEKQLSTKVKDVSFNLEQILVEVFPQSPCSSSTEDELRHAQAIFTEINKAEPVKLVDMPGVARVDERSIIDDAATVLQKAFPDMFKPSQRCRSPHVNVDNLRDALFTADILERHSIKNHTALLKWIDDKNRELREKYTDSEGNNKVSATALSKAIKHGFFLGLESSWLYR